VVTQRRVTKRLAHPVCTSSCWFGNQGHDYLGPRDFCCVVTTHGELLREMVPSGTPCTAASHADRGSPRVCWQGRTTALKYQGTKFRKAAREKDVGPTHGFTASPKVGPGATIDTLQTGFPCIQALSWDEGQDVRSCTPVCLVTLAPDSWLGAAPGPPCVPWLQLPPVGLGQLRSCHMSRGSSSRLLARGSSGAITCLVALDPAS
jgi:hypothetical protein